MTKHPVQHLVGVLENVTVCWTNRVCVCVCVDRVRLEAFSDNSGKLQLSLQEIIEWLTAKDEELSEQLPIGGDVGAVQHQREFQQVMRTVIPLQHKYWRERVYYLQRKSTSLYARMISTRLGQRHDDTWIHTYNTKTVCVAEWTKLPPQYKVLRGPTWPFESSLKNWWRLCSRSCTMICGMQVAAPSLRCVRLGFRRPVILQAVFIMCGKSWNLLLPGAATWQRNTSSSGVLSTVLCFRAAHVKNGTQHLEFTDNRQSKEAACADIMDIDQCWAYCPVWIHSGVDETFQTPLSLISVMRGFMCVGCAERRLEQSRYVCKIYLKSYLLWLIIYFISIHAC